MARAGRVPAFRLGKCWCFRKDLNGNRAIFVGENPPRLIPELIPHEQSEIEKTFPRTG